MVRLEKAESYEVTRRKINLYLKNSYGSNTRPTDTKRMNMNLKKIYRRMIVESLI